jgi:hypothetical protein
MELVRHSTSIVIRWTGGKDFRKRLQTVFTRDASARRRRTPRAARRPTRRRPSRRRPALDSAAARLRGVPRELQRFQATGGGAGEVGERLVRDQAQVRQALRQHLQHDAPLEPCERGTGCSRGRAADRTALPAVAGATETEPARLADSRRRRGVTDSVTEELLRESHSALFVRRRDDPVPCPHSPLSAASRRPTSGARRHRVATCRSPRSPQTDTPTSFPVT